ncbi:hypothetical protein [Streptomyces sp. NBC_01236]|uniref:hypothetical protein n=1 Tax=Streptomyces sp. NBC_01236 TaxID=2903789 RepID=UPI002E118738|nr:hypothetical protein OG324_20380 [Streptomyces sp. NBC_01236]
MSLGAHDGGAERVGVSPAQATDTLAQVESVRAGVRGWRAPGWFPVVGCLVFGLDVAGWAAMQEERLLTLPVAVFTCCIAWMFVRMNVQVTGVQVALSQHLRNVRRMGEALGLMALSVAVWAVCRLGGAGDIACVVVPAVVGAAGAWAVCARRNRSQSPDARRAHAR